MKYDEICCLQLVGPSVACSKLVCWYAMRPVNIREHAAAALQGLSCIHGFVYSEIQNTPHMNERNEMSMWTHQHASSTDETKV